jgi:hypothetical protein
MTVSGSGRGFLLPYSMPFEKTFTFFYLFKKVLKRHGIKCGKAI